eukprot:9507874-Alexandrium_andersonii.AAC.1
MACDIGDHQEGHSHFKAPQGHSRSPPSAHNLFTGPQEKPGVLRRSNVRRAPSAAPRLPCLPVDSRLSMQERIRSGQLLACATLDDIPVQVVRDRDWNRCRAGSPTARPFPGVSRYERRHRALLPNHSGQHLSSNLPRSPKVLWPPLYLATPGSLRRWRRGQ